MLKLSPEDQAAYTVRLRVAGQMLKRARTKDELSRACDRLDALEKEFSKLQLRSVDEWQSFFEHEGRGEAFFYRNLHLDTGCQLWQLRLDLELGRDICLRQHYDYPHNLTFRWERPEPVVVPVKLTFIQKLKAWLT